MEIIMEKIEEMEKKYEIGVTALEVVSKKQNKQKGKRK